MKQNYNQMIQEMNALNIEKEKQIEFLITRIASLEAEMKRKQLLERLFFVGVLSFLIGIFLNVFKNFVLGLLLIVVSFSFLALKIISLAHKNQEKNRAKELEKLGILLNTKFR